MPPALNCVPKCTKWKSLSTCWGFILVLTHGTTILCTFFSLKKIPHQISVNITLNMYMWVVHSTQVSLIVGRVDTCLNVDLVPSERFLRFERLRPKQVWHQRRRLRFPASRPVGRLFFYPSSSSYTHTHTQNDLRRHRFTVCILQNLRRDAGTLFWLIISTQLVIFLVSIHQ